MTVARAAAGARAEALAATFLVARGLTIVQRNFRCRRGEIDLIARDGETLVFVEVRLRTRATSAEPPQHHGGQAGADRRRRALLSRAPFAHAAVPVRRRAVRRVDSDRIEWLQDMMSV